MAINSYIKYNLFFVLLFLLLNSCTKPEKASQNAEVRIGVIVTMSGEYAQSSGKQVRTAVELWEKKLKENGGHSVGSCKIPVRFFLADDQDSPQSAVAAAQKLINQDSVVALIGATKSRLALPIAALAESLHIVYITPTSTNPNVTKDKKFVFRASFTDPVQAMAIARFAAGELKAKTAGILFDDASSYNRGLAENFKNEFIKTGGSIIAYEKFVTGDKDFTAQFKVISKNPPDVLFLPNYFTEVALQTALVKKLKLNCILLGGDAWASTPDSLKPQLEGSFYCSAYSPAINDSLSSRFTADFTSAAGMPPQHTGVLTYDAIGLLLNSLENQQNPDSLKIADGLSNIKNYRGIAGTYSFPAGGDPDKAVTLMKISGGKSYFHKLFKP